MSTNGDKPLFLTSARERSRIWIGLKPESLASSPASIGRRAPPCGTSGIGPNAATERVERHGPAQRSTAWRPAGRALA